MDERVEDMLRSNALCVLCTESKAMPHCSLMTYLLGEDRIHLSEWDPVNEFKDRVPIAQSRPYAHQNRKNDTYQHNKPIDLLGFEFHDMYGILPADGYLPIQPVGFDKPGDDNVYQDYAEKGQGKE